jgi:hypothetical protein
MAVIEIEQTETSLTIKIDTRAFLFLAQFFPAGKVIGLTDPYHEMSKEKIEADKLAVENCLLETGYIEKLENREYKVDEFLGAFVYSMLHPQNLMFLRNEHTGEVVHFHLLDNWLLGWEEEESQIIMTLYRDQENLESDIYAFINDDEMRETEKDFKLRLTHEKFNHAAKSYFSGETEAARSFLEVERTQASVAIEENLVPLFEPDMDFWFRIYKNYSSFEQDYFDQQLLYSNKTIFWISYINDENAESPIMDISVINKQSLKIKINQLIPIV